MLNFTLCSSLLYVNGTILFAQNVTRSYSKTLQIFSHLNFLFLATFSTSSSLVRILLSLRLSSFLFLSSNKETLSLTFFFSFCIYLYIFALIRLSVSFSLQFFSFFDRVLSLLFLAFCSSIIFPVFICTYVHKFPCLHHSLLFKILPLSKVPY